MIKFGACIGAVDPAIESLGISWAYGTYANSLCDDLKDAPYEFVPITFEREPDETWRRFCDWSNYGHYWMIGNEPHTQWDNNRPVSEIVDVAVRQMSFIKSFDVFARFILTCSTQGQLPYQWHNSKANFIGDFWQLLPRKWKIEVDGFHMHIYPRWVSDNESMRWDTHYFIKYVRGLRRWMRERGIKGREVWVSEFGYEREFENDENYEKCIIYLRQLLAHPGLPRLIDRFAFYPASEMNAPNGTNGYLPLISGGEMTRLGYEYANRKNRKIQWGQK